MPSLSRKTCFLKDNFEYGGVLTHFLDSFKFFVTNPDPTECGKLKAFINFHNLNMFQLILTISLLKVLISLISQVASDTSIIYH